MWLSEAQGDSVKLEPSAYGSGGNTGTVPHSPTGAASAPGMVAHSSSVLIGQVPIHVMHVCVTLALRNDGLLYTFFSLQVPLA